MSTQPPVRSSSVSACLVVESIEDELVFLSGVFEASVEDQRRNPQGHIWHAAARIGDSTIILGRAEKDQPATQSMLYVWMDNVEHAYRQALKHGATPVQEPKDQPDGGREAAIRDAQGNTWRLARELRKPSNKEVERRLVEQRKSRL